MSPRPLPPPFTLRTWPSILWLSCGLGIHTSRISPAANCSHIDPKKYKLYYFFSEYDFLLHKHINTKYILDWINSTLRYLLVICIRTVRNLCWRFTTQFILKCQELKKVGNFIQFHSFVQSSFYMVFFNC